MKTEKTSAFLNRIVDKLRPSDLLHSEHRLAVRARIDHLLEETGLDRIQFRSRIRQEMNELRVWLAGARDLTHEALAEICALFHISMGDLLTEQA